VEANRRATQQDRPLDNEVVLQRRIGLEGCNWRRNWTHSLWKCQSTFLGIPRKLVFDSMMMVKSGILAKLHAAKNTKYPNMKTQDDVGFFPNLAGDRPTLSLFWCWYVSSFSPNLTWLIYYVQFVYRGREKDFLKYITKMFNDDRIVQAKQTGQKQPANRKKTETSRLRLPYFEFPLYSSRNAAKWTRLWVKAALLLKLNSIAEKKICSLSRAEYWPNWNPTTRIFVIYFFRWVLSTTATDWISSGYTPLEDNLLESSGYLMDMFWIVK
jgi:hypothetical protein